MMCLNYSDQHPALLYRGAAGTPIHGQNSAADPGLLLPTRDIRVTQLVTQPGLTFAML